MSISFYSSPLWPDELIGKISGNSQDFGTLLN